MLAEMHRLANSRDFNAVLDVAVDGARKEIKTAREMATWQQRARAVTPPGEYSTNPAKLELSV